MHGYFYMLLSMHDSCPFSAFESLQCWASIGWDTSYRKSIPSVISPASAVDLTASNSVIRQLSKNQSTSSDVSFAKSLVLWNCWLKPNTIWCRLADALPIYAIILVCLLSAFEGARFLRLRLNSEIGEYRDSGARPRMFSNLLLQRMVCGERQANFQEGKIIDSACG